MEPLFRQYGQGHLFDDQNQLSPGSKVKLLDVLKKVNFPLLMQGLQKSYELMLQSNQDIIPFTGDVLDLSDVDMAEVMSKYSAEKVITSSEQDAFLSGLGCISRGESGVVLLAGGQGSRLNFNHPKAMFSLGEAADSILETHIVKILALQCAAKRFFPESEPVIPLQIMTSAATHDETVAFCESKQYYGLSVNQVFFIQQSTLPVVTYVPTTEDDTSYNVLRLADGRCVKANLVLNEEFQLAQSPNGNGGVYLAIEENLPVVLSKYSNLKYWHLVGIDNILMKLSDPVMLGLLSQGKYDMCVKSVKKQYAEEKVGVIAMRKGKYGVVEYSEMAHMASKKNSETGELEFQDANIVSFMVTRDFLQYCITHKDTLPYHIAENKKVKSHNRDLPCTKLELFNFDVMGLLEPGKQALVRNIRGKEFAPIKNSDENGVDCPRTAKEVYLGFYQGINKHNVDQPTLVRQTYIGE